MKNLVLGKASRFRISVGATTPRRSLILKVAERQGFEPWIPCGIPAFQACAFSQSAISPRWSGLIESNTNRALSKLDGDGLKGACAAGAPRRRQLLFFAHQGTGPPTRE